MKTQRLLSLRSRYAAGALACCLIAAFGTSTAWSQASSQAWPTRPITLVVPFTAGSTADIIARLVMDQVSNDVGRPVVIENRGGGGGVIGSNMVAKAAPDGHTLLASGSLASAHALSASLPYSTLEDFTPVISLGLQPLVLVTGPPTGIQTVNELIVRARARSGAMNFASAGVGSATHFAAERFRLSAGFDAQHIPFRGPTEALTEIMAGRVDFFVAPTPSALSLIKEGKVIALAGSGTKRAAVLPDVPTTTELGLVDSTYLLYSGLFSPAKTDRVVVSKIYQVMAKALQVPSVQDKLQTLGVEPMPMSQEQFERYFRNEVEANVKLVKVANIPLQK
jgi:tripartite-type tricarboxylate transporter receptor subunit TctC